MQWDSQKNIDSYYTIWVCQAWYFRWQSANENWWYCPLGNSRELSLVLKEGIVSARDLSWSVSVIAKVLRTCGSIKGGGTLSACQNYGQRQFFVMAPVHKKEVTFTNFFFSFFFFNHYITTLQPMRYFWAIPKCQRDDVVAGVGLQFDGSY